MESKEKFSYKKEPQIELIKIVPLKDHVIKHNKFFYDLKKGVEIQVEKMFIAGLKTEKVIN